MWCKPFAKVLHTAECMWAISNRFINSSVFSFPNVWCQLYANANIRSNFCKTWNFCYNYCEYILSSYSIQQEIVNCQVCASHTPCKISSPLTLVCAGQDPVWHWPVWRGPDHPGGPAPGPPLPPPGRPHHGQHTRSTRTPSKGTGFITGCLLRI